MARLESKWFYPFVISNVRDERTSEGLNIVFDVKIKWWHPYWLYVIFRVLIGKPIPIKSDEQMSEEYLQREREAFRRERE